MSGSQMELPELQMLLDAAEPMPADQRALIQQDILRIGTLWRQEQRLFSLLPNEGAEASLLYTYVRFEAECLLREAERLLARAPQRPRVASAVAALREVIRDHYVDELRAQRGPRPFLAAVEALWARHRGMAIPPGMEKANLFMLVNQLRNNYGSEFEARSLSPMRTAALLQAREEIGHRIKSLTRALGLMPPRLEPLLRL